MSFSIWAAGVELFQILFPHVDPVWGIVPLHFSLLLNEMTSAEAKYRTAIQAGFGLVWAGAQLTYPCFKAHAPGGRAPGIGIGPPHSDCLQSNACSQPPEEYTAPNLPHFPTRRRMA